MTNKLFIALQLTFAAQTLTNHNVATTVYAHQRF